MLLPTLNSRIIKAKELKGLKNEKQQSQTISKQRLKSLTTDFQTV